MKWPVAFIGHGSPMNMVENNRFTQGMRGIAQAGPIPKAILCVSAHWLTDGSEIVSSHRPKQIFDFYGFPDELYRIRYEPHGAPDLAKKVSELKFSKTHSQVKMTTEWGLDHGAWAVAREMFPQANVPILQLSIDRNKSPLQHFHLAREMAEQISFQSEGLQILGSGNLVHNLRLIDWNSQAPTAAWAEEFQKRLFDVLQNSSLSSESKIEKIFSLPNLAKAHPSIEHLLPLVYCLGFSSDLSNPQVLYSGFQNASISMTSLGWPALVR